MPLKERGVVVFVIASGLLSSQLGTSEPRPLWHIHTTRRRQPSSLELIFCEAEATRALLISFGALPSQAPGLMQRLHVNQQIRYYEVPHAHPLVRLKTPIRK